MAKIYVFLADGCEEIEALTPVDLLRRAGNEVCTVSVMGRQTVCGSHGIAIGADAILEEASLADGDLFVLPGGMPGTKHLLENQTLAALLKQKYGEGKRLAAICAAPWVLGNLGMLQGRRAVCYPGMEEHLTGATALSVPVVTDGPVTTARGVGAAIDFALELIRMLNGEEKAVAVKEEVVYPYGC